MVAPNNLDPNALKEAAIEAAKSKASSMFSGASILNFIKTQGPMFLLAGLAGYFLPWWASVPIFVVVGAWLGKTPAASFAHGTTTGTAIWSGMAAMFNNINAGKMAGMMGLVLGQGKFEVSSLHLILATGIMGGLLVGVGTWTGSFLRRWLKPIPQAQPLS